MVAHTFNLSIQEADTGRSLILVYSKFQDSQDYTVKPCLKTITKTQQNKSGQADRSLGSFDKLWARDTPSQKQNKNNKTPQQ